MTLPFHLSCTLESPLLYELSDDRFQVMATGASAVAFGSNANAAHANSAAFGNGATTTRDDLVRIFDDGPDVNPVSVEEQRQFFEAWGKSLAA